MSICRMSSCMKWVFAISRGELQTWKRKLLNRPFGSLSVIHLEFFDLRPYNVSGFPNCFFPSMTKSACTSSIMLMIFLFCPWSQGAFQHGGDQRKPTLVIVLLMWWVFWTKLPIIPMRQSTNCPHYINAAMPLRSIVIRRWMGWDCCYFYRERPL
jgi:hypothetical protein